MSYFLNSAHIKNDNQKLGGLNCISSPISLMYLLGLWSDLQEFRVFVDNLEQNRSYNYSEEKGDYNSVNCYTKCHSSSAIFQSYVTRPKRQWRHPEFYIGGLNILFAKRLGANFGFY